MAILRRAIAIACLLTACGTAPATPSATPSAPAAVTSPTIAPTATAGATAAGTPAPSASRSPIPLPSTALIVAPSATVVWVLVAEDRLFVSRDRGDTWTETMLPKTGTEGVSFIDDREGWSLSPDSVGVTSSSSGCTTARAPGLWRTSDGAATWQAVTAANVVAGCMGAVTIVDVQRGFLSGWKPGTPVTIYRTADAGRIWTGSRLPDPPGFTTVAGGSYLRAGPVRAFGSTLLVTASAVGPTTGQSYAYRSTDGGISWTYAGAAPNRTQDVAFVTAARWLQIGPGDSKETTDGGATWHAFATGYQQAAPVAPAVTFGDAQVGYATVRGSIQRTTDGGVRWSTVKTPGT